MKHRMIAYLLAIMITLSMLSGCGIVIIHHSSNETSFETTTPMTTPEETTTDPDDPPLEDLRDTQIDYLPTAEAYLNSIFSKKYDNDSFILVSSDISYLTPSDDSVNTSVSSATYKRNQMIQDTFGINLIITKDTTENIQKSIANSEKDGLVYADLVMIPSRSVVSFASEGTLSNLRSMMFVDFSAPYFNSSSLDAFSYGNHTWALAGSASITSNYLPCILFNREMFDSSIATIPYELVKSGNWTWDQYYAGSIAVSGEDSVDTVIANDSFALSAFSSCGLKTTDSSVGSIPSCSYSTDCTSIINKLHLLYTFGTPYASSDGLNKFFSEKEALYCITTIDATRGMTRTQTRWGLVPMPKYTVEDSSYHTLASTQTMVFAIPSKINDNALSGRILSALNAASFGVIISADANAKKDTYFRDQESADMYMKILFSLTFDYAHTLGAQSSSIYSATETLLNSSIQNASFEFVYPSGINIINQILQKEFPN